jgi:hypothetical protein
MSGLGTGNLLNKMGGKGALIGLPNLGTTNKSTGLFQGNENTPTPPPPTPTWNDAAGAGQAKADELRKRRGMAASILAGQSSGINQPTTQAASLLGS